MCSVCSRLKDQGRRGLDKCVFYVCVCVFYVKGYESLAATVCTSTVHVHARVQPILELLLVSYFGG